ncbi:MAG TPA: hypothetical protein VHK88_20080 [Aquihabitans sp.]|nr:hypothetical protein [Aquihabitans sp.]
MTLRTVLGLSADDLRLAARTIDAFTGAPADDWGLAARLRAAAALLDPPTEEPT